MVREWMLGAAVAIAVAGCGKSGGDSSAAAPGAMDSPKATAQALVGAIKNKSAATAVALLPPDDLMKKTFECPDDSMGKRVAEMRERAQKEFGDAKDAPAVELGDFDKIGTEEKLYRVNDDYEGCKVKAPVTVHKSKLELRITKDGKTDFDGETWRFYKFGDDGKWYYLK